MSFPGMAMGVASAGASAAALSPIDSMMYLFSSNPYFIGLMMFFLNVGGRFIGLEISKQQEMFFQHPWVRRGLIFVVLFVATRNLAVAFWCTVGIVLLFGYLFNENSSMCLFGRGGVAGASCQTEGGGMTPEEREILQRLSAKAQRFLAPKGEAPQGDAPVQPMEIYGANMALLKRV
jgi:hypothetical protein